MAEKKTYEELEKRIQELEEQPKGSGQREPRIQIPAVRLHLRTGR